MVVGPGVNPTLAKYVSISDLLGCLDLVEWNSGKE